MSIPTVENLANDWKGL